MSAGQVVTTLRTAWTAVSRYQLAVLLIAPACVIIARIAVIHSWSIQSTLLYSVAVPLWIFAAHHLFLTVTFTYSFYWRFGLYRFRFGFRHLWIFHETRDAGWQPSTATIQSLVYCAQWLVVTVVITASDKAGTPLKSIVIAASLYVTTSLIRLSSLQPSVLLLGTSQTHSLKFQRALNLLHFVQPASLLKTDVWRPAGTSIWAYGHADYRTPGAKWEHIVQALLETTPVIILDMRGDSANLTQEIEWIAEPAGHPLSPALRRARSERVIFIITRSGGLEKLSDDRKEQIRAECSSLEFLPASAVFKRLAGQFGVRWVNSPEELERFAGDLDEMALPA